jgi:Uma2 family endonuclease
MKTVEPVPIPRHGAQIWPLSVNAHRALREAGLLAKNTELFHGIVYKKMSKSPLHNALVRKLFKLLGYVPFAGRFVSSEQPIACGDSEPEQNVAVIRGAEKDFWHDRPHTAELIREVCVTSLDYDPSKLPAYAGAGVKECWLVLAPEKQIEVRRLPEDGRFTERAAYGPGGKLVCAAFPEFTMELDALFAK